MTRLLRGWMRATAKPSATQTAPAAAATARRGCVVGCRRLAGLEAAAVEPPGDQQEGQERRHDGGVSKAEAGGLHRGPPGWSSGRVGRSRQPTNPLGSAPEPIPPEPTRPNQAAVAPKPAGAAGDSSAGSHSASRTPTERCGAGACSGRVQLPASFMLGALPTAICRRPSSGGIPGRLDGIGRSPGVQAALERLGLEAELTEL